jgi:hypothetical protein
LSFFQIGCKVYTDIRLYVLVGQSRAFLVEQNGKGNFYIFAHNPAHRTWRGLQRKGKFKITFFRIFKIMDLDEEKMDRLQNTSLVAEVFIGANGGGSHAIYDSVSSLADGVDTSPILVTGFTVISLRFNDDS